MVHSYQGFRNVICSLIGSYQDIWNVICYFQSCNKKTYHDGAKIF